MTIRHGAFMANADLTAVAHAQPPRLTVIDGGGQGAGSSPAERLERKRRLRVVAETDRPQVMPELVEELAYGAGVDQALRILNDHAHAIADDGSVRDLTGALACALARAQVTAQAARARALARVCLPGQPDPTADAAGRAGLTAAVADMLECEILAHLVMDGPLDEATAHGLAADAYDLVVVDHMACACAAAGDDLLCALIGRRRVGALAGQERLSRGDWRVLLSDFLPRHDGARRPGRQALAQRLSRMLAAG